MTPAHRDAIEEAIASLDAQGRPWTNKRVYSIVGGSYSQLSQYLKQRRAGRAPAAPAPAVPGAVQAVGAEGPVPLPPAPVRPQLAVLQEAVREAEAVLLRLTRERDSQQTAVQEAVLALYQARRDGQRLVRAVRAAQQGAACTPAHLAAGPQATVHHLQAQLAALVGAADAAEVVSDLHFTPAGLRER